MQFLFGLEDDRSLLVNSEAFRLVPPSFPIARGNLDPVDAGLLPPGQIVAHAVHEAVMDSTNRHGELIAGLAVPLLWQVRLN
jgi:hypothetical protein